MTGEEELLTLGSSEHVDAWYELIKSSSLHNVVYAGHGVDVVGGVERAGDVALLCPVLPPTHVLAADGQPRSLASTVPATPPGHQPHTDRVGVGVHNPFRVRPLLVADPQPLLLFSVLVNLKVAGVTGEVE